MGVPDHPCPSFSHGWQLNPGCIVRKLCATTALLRNIPSRQQNQVLPGFEPGLQESESWVLTTTL